MNTKMETVEDKRINKLNGDTSVTSERTKYSALELHLQTIPSKYRRLHSRVLSGNGSKRDIFKAMCQSCNGLEEVSRRTRQCSISECPIHPYRPYQSNNGGER